MPSVLLSSAKKYVLVTQIPCFRFLLLLTLIANQHKTLIVPPDTSMSKSNANKCDCVPWKAHKLANTILNYRLKVVIRFKDALNSTSCRSTYECHGHKQYTSFKIPVLKAKDMNYLKA